MKRLDGADEICLSTLDLWTFLLSKIRLSQPQVWSLALTTANHSVVGIDICRNFTCSMYLFNCIHILK